MERYTCFISKLLSYIYISDSTEFWGNLSNLLRAFTVKQIKEGQGLIQLIRFLTKTIVTENLELDANENYWASLAKIQDNIITIITTNDALCRSAGRINWLLFFKKEHTTPLKTTIFFPICVCVWIKQTWYYMLLI